MTKLRLYDCTLFLLLALSCQTGFSQYQLKVNCVDRDSLFNQQNLNLTASFRNRTSCLQYIDQIPALLQSRGFAGASLDSISYDSAQARVRLYLGEAFSWAHIKTRSADAAILSGIGWNEKKYDEKPLNFHQFQLEQQRLLDWLENNGYP